MGARLEPADQFLAALARAEDAVSTLDARVQASPLAEGWRARIVCHEAVAWEWMAGDTAPLAEVVLHDTQLGQEAPSSAVAHAVAALRRRRRAARRTAEVLETWAGVQAVLGRRPVAAGSRSEATQSLLDATQPKRLKVEVAAAAPSPGIPYLRLWDRRACPADQDEEVFQFWIEAQHPFTPYPPLLQAAAALDHWTALDPLVRETDVGALVVEAALRRTQRLRASPLLVESGRRVLSRSSRYWNGPAPASERAVFWLDAIAAGAQVGLAELDRLLIARRRLDLALKDRRSSSRLPALADLLLRSPVVSAPMVAESLGVSGQAARMLLAEFDGVHREMTGRRSYRIWSV